jgi:hypothetical protein
MSLTISTKTYASHRETPDAVSYAGPGHTITLKDQLDLKRVFPKPTNSFKGVARPNVKFVRTVVVNATTGETADMIYNGSASVPVGVSDSDIDAFLADIEDFYGLQAAKDLYKSLDIHN